MPPLSLAILFFLIASIYSSVGFGGGSLYIAFLAFSSVEYLLIPIIALICNIVVVSINCLFHYKQNSFNLTDALPFIMLSIPASFLGGYLNISETTLIFLLAMSLFISAILLIFNHQNNQNSQVKLPRLLKKNQLLFFVILGALIGFLSGMVGIGGGIFLAPILHLFRFKNANQITSIASIYILFNSLSGFFGQLSKLNLAEIDFPFLIFVLSCLIGVILGAMIGNKIRFVHFKQHRIRQITGVIILIASIKLWVG